MLLGTGAVALLASRRGGGPGSAPDIEREGPSLLAGAVGSPDTSPSVNPTDEKGP